MQETEPEINARIDREITEQLKREYPEMPYQGDTYGYEEQPNPTTLGMLAFGGVTATIILGVIATIILSVVWSIGG